MRRLSWMAAAGVAVTVPGGCSAPSNPWQFASPPAVAPDAQARAPQPGRTVIALAPLAGPDAPQLDWPDVGAEMTETLRRTLVNDAGFEVRIARDAEALLRQPGYGPNSGTTSDPVDVDFLLRGKVTDFHHTAGLPKHASRWGLFSRRSEAVVAIDWTVIDVRSRRVVAADHTYGTHDAKVRKSIEELYEGLDISAYLFWNTPLGKAAHEAVDATVSQLRRVLPARIGQPAIVDVTGGRKLKVQGGWSWGLAQGQELFVTLRDPHTGSLSGVYDVDTGHPLRVRLGSVDKESCTAWLMGRPPADVTLRGAVLARRRPPPAAGELAGRRDLAADPDA